MGAAESRNERFYHCCGLGKAHLVERMLESDRMYQTINVDWVSFETKSTPLLIASANGHDNVVDILLKNKANPNKTDSCEYTSLHHAAQRGHSEIIKKLIAAGCCVDARDQQLWSPLMKACYWCQPDAALVLLEAGANVNLRNSVNRSCLHELCRSPVKGNRFTDRRHHHHHNHQQSSTESSIGAENKTPPPSSSIYEYFTSDQRRHDSRSSGTSGDSVSTSIGTSEEINTLSLLNGGSGTAAAMNASASHLAEIALALVEAGADINQRSNEKLTPLIYASYHNHVEVALVLIESNCEIDAQDQQGWTALHWACDRNNPNIVQLLLDKGCDRNIRCNNGMTAWMRAKSEKIRQMFPAPTTTDDQSIIPNSHTIIFTQNDNR